jgi:hypothetical protein
VNYPFKEENMSPDSYIRVGPENVLKVSAIQHITRASLLSHS